MKINSLKLRGFTGIQKGMGLPELELDLSGMSGLIALSGKNGAGKTTVLESLQPYRTLASRKRSLASHVYLRDSFKALSFDFQGDRYDTKVLIDADSGKQEGYIWKNGESMVDGKVRNYDAYIRELFGSEDLFFNSIFCAQNASKLSDLTTGKLKELFAEFLRLNQYIAYEATTKQCITLLTSQGFAYGSQASSIRERLASYGALQTRLSQAQADLDSANETHGRFMQQLVELKADIVKAKEALAANKVIEDRLTEHKACLFRLQTEKETASRDYETKAEVLRQKIRQAKTAIEAMTKILNDRDRIVAAVDRRKDLSESIEAKSKGIEAGYAKREAVQTKIKALEKRMETEIRPHPDESRMPVLLSQISMLRAQTQDLDRRDPECRSTVCGFIATALEAQQQIPALETKLSAIRDAVQKHTADNNVLAMQLEEQLRELKEEDAGLWKAIKELQAVLAEQKRVYSELAALASKEGDLREAIVRKEAAEKEQHEAFDHGMALKAEFDEKVKVLKAEMAGIQKAMEGLAAQLDRTVKARIINLETQEEHMENSKRDFEARISDAMATIRTIQDKITEQAVLGKQLAELEEKRGSITSQVSEWTYLRNALSKDGIRALEIDSVAPSISAYANQILFNTFGPAYSVKLRTQDDEGREVLDILALEPDGKETLLDDLSGGEKCWSLKALRLALTLIAKQKSGKQLLSAFSDEEDGALDAGNAQNFIHMYRAFMEAGGFETCYFISHRPECVAMADNVLTFDHGGISVN